MKSKLQLLNMKQLGCIPLFWLPRMQNLMGNQYFDVQLSSLWNTLSMNYTGEEARASELNSVLMLKSAARFYTTPRDISCKLFNKLICI